MTHLIAAHFQSSNSTAQASTAQLLHAQTGGIMLKPGPLDAYGNRVANAPTENGDALENHYCAMMASRRGGIIDVSPEERQSMIGFIQTRRAILTEMKAIIVSVSPDNDSQNAAIETLTAICEAGVSPSDIRILATDMPQNTGAEDVLSKAFAFAREAGITIVPEAAIPVSTSFAKALQFKMPIAAVLNKAVDFETELTVARLNGAPEKITHALAHKVIAQRDLLDSADTFRRVAGLLGLPCISQDEWRAEFPLATNRKRAKVATVE
ncbi:hypothetical protein [Paraburkholderia sp. J67]|uniref:hypothetical protein n=1 Tax=Paraburkholderia sp. J67 TaxID=2805435 RepID=UPI002ABDB643|nr:hypothetical protein [Paraburkholderia sp. J67]